MSTGILFGLFALTLVGIAAAHRHAMKIALAGLASVLAVRLGMTDFDPLEHFGHEWVEIANLGGLLLGFTLLASHFERSHLPKHLCELLPLGRLGAFLLLVLVAVLSAVLDNIAAALIGGTAAQALFGGRVHIGYLAAIVAASNAGGAGSVVGDTTTTMMWLAGAPPLEVARAAVGALVVVLFCGYFAARQQHALQPIQRGTVDPEPLDPVRLVVVLAILVGAVGANLAFGLPAVGVWAALVLAAPVRQPEWNLLGNAATGAVFLLSLVLTASMMPVEELPAASPATAFGLGIVSAFFDNIPLTKLAIEQNGYDWGFLAYAVGFGGSMLWFGSSAGVALSAFFPKARSALGWVRGGWHLPVAYALGFLVMLVLLGWKPMQLHHP
ncbi:MAG: citrate transporter [Planctomycetota bacterium]